MPIKFALKTPVARDNSPTSDDFIFLPGRDETAILLIHGLTGSPYEMGFVARRLHRQGFTVFCPRIANHGAPLAVIKATTWEECFDSMKKAFLDFREKVPAGTPLFVGGLSAGALLALLLADEFSREIKGVACLSPTLFYDGWNMPWTRHLLPLAYATPLRNFFYFKEESPYGIKNEGVRRRIHASYGAAKLGQDGDFARSGYPFFPATILCEMRKLVKHTTGRLEGITAPVQIQQAVQDDMSSPRNSEFVHKNIGSAQKEIVLLHDSYHVITADHEREAVADHIADFCRRVVKTGAGEISLV
jgi:carboxylesterase